MHDTEQDARLELLSHSINRHQHMSIQIGDELDVQNDLLDDTEGRINATSARMGRAGRRLDQFAKSSKDHGEQCGVCQKIKRQLGSKHLGDLSTVSSITIVGLILVLLLLIIVFKT